MSAWNARADTPTALIMWLGALLAVIICITWYVRNIYPVNVEIDKIDEDLKNLQQEFSAACNSKYYRYEYNPNMESGTLSINGRSVCIKTKIEKCRLSLCDTNTNKNFSLKDMSFLVIERNESLFSIIEK